MRSVGSNSSDNGTVVSSGAQIDLGVKTAAIYRITEQGTLAQTGNTLNVAIQGNGYFQVALPSGETAYTATARSRWRLTDGHFTALVSIDIPDTDAVQIRVSGQVIQVTAASVATRYGQQALNILLPF